MTRGIKELPVGANAGECYQAIIFEGFDVFLVDRFIIRDVLRISLCGGGAMHITSSFIHQCSFPFVTTFSVRPAVHYTGCPNRCE